jgi:gamma-glutamyltranspeptidase/glutathione hydrolase
MTMRLIKCALPDLPQQGSEREWPRQCKALLLFASILSLAACDPRTAPGTIGHVEGFSGILVADEPRAALVGRDILSSGGTAADAAIAMYFTMAVTLPSRVGVAGGGVCVVHDPKSKKSEALEFLPAAPAEAGQSAPRPTAVPAMPRGMFALHAKYGKLRWEQLLGPAEGLARFGNPVSRALAADIALVAGPLLMDPGSKAAFSGPSGGAAQEGDPVKNVELAAFLSRLRVRGPADLYGGALAHEVIAAVKNAGGTLSIEDLRSVQARWREPLGIKFGNLTALFPPPPASAGLVEAQMWSVLAEQKLYDKASAEERPHLLAEVAMRAFSERARWMTPEGDSSVSFIEVLGPGGTKRMMEGYNAQRHTKAESLNPPPADFPENPAAAGFAVADRNGQSVVCASTMNNLFGTGRIIPGIGALMAAVPGRAGRGPYQLGPMLVIAHNVYEFRFAAIASGGQAAPTALINVAARALIEERPLVEAVAAPRIHHPGQPDTVFVEKTDSPARLETLSQRGYDVAEVDSIGRVSAIYCPKGLPPNPETCQVASDPRGNGYGMGVGKK